MTKLAFHSSNSQQNPESGFALIAVTVAMIFVAGIIAILFIVSSSVSRTSTGSEAAMGLQTFADGVVNLCPTVIDAALGIGSFQNTPLASALQSGVGTTITLQDANLGTELTISVPTLTNKPWYSDNAGPGTYIADIILETDYFSADLDIDYQLLMSPTGQALEFGSRTQVGTITRYLMYRCHVVATDDQDRTAMAYGYVRREL